MLKYKIEQRLATLTLNRPEHRNALSPELSMELIQALHRADADGGVKCIALEGEGEHFCAGGDLKGFSDTLSLEAAERYELFERKLTQAGRLPTALLQVSKPVIAVVRGAVAGAGLALCLAADYVLACEDSHYSAAHIHIGLPLDCGLSALLVAAMGIKRAKRFALLGERIGAHEALALGIVTEIVPAARLAQVAAERSAALIRGPAVAMAATKALLNAAAYPGFADALMLETRHVAHCAATEDFRRGVSAALARKPPEFEP